MKDIPEGLSNFITRHEGKVNMPYKDTKGIWTVGIGTRFPIDDEEMQWLFEHRLHKFVKAAIKIFPDLWSFGDARAFAIIDMIYNLGVAGFRGFKNMISAIHDRDWERAAREAEDLDDGAQPDDWYQTVGERGKEIVKMLRTGMMP